MFKQATAFLGHVFLGGVLMSTMVHASPFAGTFTKDGQQVDYLHNTPAGYTNTDWMQHLPDDTLISDVSIPGTHDTMALHGGIIPQTQVLDVKSQLEMGIRYLDGRFTLKNGELWGYHGIIPQHVSFEQFFEAVTQFLDEHPSEVLFIGMQNEGGIHSHEQEFYHTFLKSLEPYKSKNFIPEANNFTVAEGRGKFIFIRGEFNAFSRIGISQNELPIQDNYILTSNWDLYRKWQDAKNHFESIQSSDELSLNYLSGAVGSFPFFVASGKFTDGTHGSQLWTGICSSDTSIYPDFPRASCTGSFCCIDFLGMNMLTSQWISEHENQRLGIVITDFPGGRLVDRIIQNNQRLLPKKTAKKPSRKTS